MIKKILCHNCGKTIKPDDKRLVLVKINSIKAKFHNKTCFRKWNRHQKTEYDGGIIQMEKNNV